MTPQCLIAPMGESNTTCDCCGMTTRTIWGTADAIRDNTATHLALYYLRWTPSQPLETHPAEIDLIFGPWGDDTSADDRQTVALVHFVQNEKPGVMIVDAQSRAVAQSDLAGHMMRRDEVRGTPLATQAFAIFDAILLQDPRLH